MRASTGNYLVCKEIAKLSQAKVIFNGDGADEVIGGYLYMKKCPDAKEFDKEQSGLYMIKEVCHHFDTEKSYTSLKLIRDTFGVNIEVKK